MACRTVLRSVILTDSWRPLHHTQSSLCSSLNTHNYKPSNSRLNGDLFVTIRAPNFNFARTIHHVKCSHSDTISPEDNQGPPHEVILKAISEVSKTEGRVGQTTNMVIGGTVTDDATNEWRSLDKKVNTYPTVREFTAIGTGGDDFVHAMVGVVEKVLQEPIPEGCVKQKLSSGGKYVSVNIGPVQVISFEQVQDVYNGMRGDSRMKYFF